MVIIGLGDTGVLVASRLVKQFNVIGITTKPNLVSGQELGKRLTDLPWWRVHYNTPLKHFLGSVWLFVNKRHVNTACSNTLFEL